MDRKQHGELLESASTADCMSGYCSFAAKTARRGERALWTCPSEAEAAGFAFKTCEAALPVRPSSAAMRRRTNGQPIGGAWLCS